MSELDRLILKMTEISKTFPGVKALESVDFDLKQGEIHALMGENGAGKSTLIKVLTGVEHPDSGTITLDGREVQVKSPQHAQELGISTVYQEINLCPNLTVAENILIGREPRRCRPHRLEDDEPSGQTDAAAAGRRYRRHSDAWARTRSPSSRWRPLCARLEVSSAKILILDEPTSSLDAHETDQLFEVMRKLRSEGMAIIFITHFIDQVYAISDRITVLRNGNLVGSYDTAALPQLQLIANMLGRILTDLDDVI